MSGVEALMAIMKLPISYAQDMEDIILYRSLHTITNGFYIDVGCHHPTILSVTNFFTKEDGQGSTLIL